MPGFLISAVIGAAFSSLFSGAAFLTSLAFAVAKGVAVYLIRSLFADDPEPPPQPQTNFVQAVSASQYVFGYSRITPPLVFAGRAVDSEATTEDLDALFGGDMSETLGFEFRYRNHGNMVCVYTLSEGTAGIEGIERMWANNVEVPLKLHATTATYKHYVSEAPYRDRNPGKGYPTLMAFVIPAATETGSAATKSALAAVMQKLYPNKWTADHGLPMAHMVVIYKPTANNRRTDGTPERSKEACMVNGVPKLEVLLKGMKLALPTDADGTLATATWTRNAADIRWWYETHIRGRTVNYASYAAAKTICGQTVNPPGSPATSTPALNRIRYAADGAFRANEDLDAVGAQLDRCWQGFTALKNGEWHFYPGSNRAVATTIDAADVIRVERTQLGAGIRDRYNQISTSMQQSANADWQQTSLPLLIDGDAKTADGGLPLELKWGTLGYIIDPYQAVRCMRLALRRGRRTNLYQVTCVPGAMMANAELHPGDVVTFNHPLIHAINQRCVILNSTINPDMSVSLQLLREDSTVYTAAITDVPFDASGELSLNSVDNNREQEESEKITARSTDGSALSISSDCIRNVLAETSGLIWFWQPVGATTFEWRDGTMANSQWTRDDTKLLWYYVSDDSELVALSDENGNHHSLATLRMPVSPSTRTALDVTEGDVVTGVGASTSGGTDDVPTRVSISVSRTTGVRGVESETKVRYYVLATTAALLGVTKANLVIRPLDDEDDFGTQWCDTTPVTTPSGGGGDTMSTTSTSGTTTTTDVNINRGSGTTDSGDDTGSDDNTVDPKDVALHLVGAHTPDGHRSNLIAGVIDNTPENWKNWSISINNLGYTNRPTQRENLVRSWSTNDRSDGRTIRLRVRPRFIDNTTGTVQSVSHVTKFPPASTGTPTALDAPTGGNVVRVGASYAVFHANLVADATFYQYRWRLKEGTWSSWTNLVWDGNAQSIPWVALIEGTGSSKPGLAISSTITAGVSVEVQFRGRTASLRGAPSETISATLKNRAPTGGEAPGNPLNLAIGTITSTSNPDGWRVRVTHDGTTQYRFNLTADDGASISFSPDSKPRDLSIPASTFSVGDVITLDAVTNEDRTTVLSRVTFTLPPRM